MSTKDFIEVVAALFTIIAGIFTVIAGILAFVYWLIPESRDKIRELTWDSKKQNFPSN